jgi:hypothetical protein
MSNAQPYTFKVVVRDSQGQPTGEVLECPACPLTIDDIQKLQPWVDAQFPDPFDVMSSAFAKGNYTVPQQQYLMSRAMEEACRGSKKIGTPAGDLALQTIGGVRELLKLSIRKVNPEFSELDAQKIFGSLTPMETLEVVAGLNR